MRDSSRTQVLSRILGACAGRRVLVIGIGGGGDVIGAMPVCRDLQRIGALPQLAGLTWKRRAQDPQARPRRISEFRNIQAINGVVGIVNPATCLADGRRHVEADVAEVLKNEVAAIDLSGGVGATRRGLREYMDVSGVSHVLAVDVGGDALCTGDEPTLRSPLCDQLMLRTLSEFDRPLLGVVGLGADGELPLVDFLARFEMLAEIGAYRGALDVTAEDARLMQTALQSGKSESSGCLARLVDKVTAAERRRMLTEMNRADACPHVLIEGAEKVALREGLRSGELTLLTAMTLFFDAKSVAATSRFASLIDEDAPVAAVAERLAAAGIATELDEDALNSQVH